MRKTLTLPVIAAAGALIAACGGTAHSTGDGAVAPADAPARAAKTASATETAAPKPATAVVKLQSTSFQPGDIHVKAGQTVRFVNNDPVAHTVTATKGAKFDSGTLDAGGSFTFKAAKPGTISYVCLIHPGMDGTITVD